MQAAVVARRSDTLPKETSHASGVDVARVRGGGEERFVREGECVEPREEGEAHAEAALGVLRGMVVGVD